MAAKVSFQQPAFLISGGAPPPVTLWLAPSPTVAQDTDTWKEINKLILEPLCSVFFFPFWVCAFVFTSIGSYREIFFFFLLYVAPHLQNEEDKTCSSMRIDPSRQTNPSWLFPNFHTAPFCKHISPVVTFDPNRTTWSAECLFGFYSVGLFCFVPIPVSMPPQWSFWIIVLRVVFYACLYLSTPNISRTALGSIIK